MAKAIKSFRYVKAFKNKIHCTSNDFTSNLPIITYIEPQPVAPSTASTSDLAAPKASTGTFLYW